MSLLTDVDRMIEGTLGYQCRRNINQSGSGTFGIQTPQCRGRMVASFDVVHHVACVTCDVCGRVALAERMEGC